MKKLLLYFFTVASLLFHSSTLSAQVVVTNSVIEEITHTFTSLFDALRAGDLKRIRFYLPAEEYAEQKVLFEQNKEYPAFLRKFYQGASLRIGRVDSVLSATDDVIAEFIVDFPGGETTTTRIRLHGDKLGRWKIRKVLAGETDQGEPSGKGRR
jgi:hypothetical protein